MKVIFLLLALFLGAIFLLPQKLREISPPSELENLTPPSLEKIEPKEEVKREVPETKLVETKTEVQKISEEISKLQEALSLPSSPPLEPKPPAVTSSALYQKALSALVNIFCEDNAKGQVILGSGAIVHPKGYVLTNAHLAEFFSRSAIDCVLRRGSPSKPFARAKVVYFPDQSLKIGETEISRKDAALLKITAPTGPNPLSSSFEYFEFDPGYGVKPGEILYSLGYPTEFFGSELVLKGTDILFALGQVKNLVNIDDDLTTAEGANLKGEISAQHGSSGGIFLDFQEGKIVGLFVGLTEGETTSDRTQFMFLSSYINRVLLEDKGLGLLEFLNTNP